MVDIRKPYTEINGDDAFSGRAEFDEPYVWPFAARHDLPLNATTAFLTPGFRTINVPLAHPLVISGRPKQMYASVIDLLENVQHGAIAADDLLAEILRILLLLKREQEERMQQLLAALKTSDSGLPLSSEEIVNLIEQHLSSPHSSRLPVLIVAAAYQTALSHLGEQARTLHAHTAADLQTGALGDVEITLVGDDEIVTSYEMKAKEVTN
jgi:DNA adenine methylase